MITTEKIERAKKTAEKLHEGHTRKNNIPYVTHLYDVAEILSKFTDDEDVIIAGLLHDTIEDVPGFTYTHLADDFGTRVADIVEGVTEEIYKPDSSHTKEERIEHFIELLTRIVEKTKKAGAESLLVMTADKIHNAQSLVLGVQEDGIEFLSKFRMPIELKMLYYRKALNAVKENDKYKIGDYFEKVLDECEKILLQKN